MFLCFLFQAENGPPKSCKAHRPSRKYPANILVPVIRPNIGTFRRSMNGSNMTGTGVKNTALQDSANEVAKIKITCSAIGAKAQNILDFLRRCTPYEANSIRVMVGYTGGKGRWKRLKRLTCYHNRFLNHGLPKESETGNETVMRH